MVESEINKDIAKAAECRSASTWRNIWAPTPTVRGVMSLLLLSEGWEIHCRYIHVEMIDIWIKYTDKYNEYADTDYSPKELREILDKTPSHTEQMAAKKQEISSLHHKMIQNIIGTSTVI